MKKLYDKSELTFSIIWIIIYVIFASIGDNLSESIGISKIVTLPILMILSFLMFCFVSKNKLFEKYGLCKPCVSSAKMLYYIPLLVLLSTNLWFGFKVNVSLEENILYILSMFCVGFLEEMIFRGFLFNAMAKNGVTSAIIVSSITFGIGHIVNLINGSGIDFVSNLLQVFYAIAIGFAFVMIYYKSKSLIVCILTHCVFNSLSIFSNEEVITKEDNIISGIIIALIAFLYACYIAFMIKDNDKNI